MDDTITMGNITIQYTFKVKDPVSALTHFIGFCLSLAGLPMLLIRAAACGSGLSTMISYAVFMVSMIMLYGASTTYHTLILNEHKSILFKKIDHMMIFVLIAGSYTPVCMTVLRGTTGYRLLVLVWGIAFAGIAFKALWVTCPKWVSSVIYIGMGWVALLAFGTIYRNMPLGGFIWLLAGGILYTVGGVLYAFKFRISDAVGAHEIFHVFVMFGSFCHYMMAFLYLVHL